MEELSYFCSVQFKSNHWGIFWSVDLEKRDTSDSGGRSCLPNQDQVTLHKAFPALLADAPACF